MNTPNFEIPANIRELAEKSVDQAKTFYDQVSAAGDETTAAFEKSAGIVQAGTNEITAKAVSLAKENNESSLDLAKKLCLEAAGETKRVLKDPEPKCLTRGFGDSSIDLEIRIWILDPADGRANVTSDIYDAVWKKFNAHGIEIPFPQRDINLKTSELAEIVKKK